MLNLNETFAAYDLGQALETECGKFEVTGPGGQKFHVTCKPGQSIINLVPIGVVPGHTPPWQIRKVADYPTETAR